MSREDFDLDPSTVVCTECSGVMRYKGGGTYVCQDCGHEVMDNYGKVRQFLEKRGPSNVFEISAGTGLSRAVVNNMLKDGRLQVSAHSSVNLICSRCGVPIRFGEYCNKCQADLNELDARNKRKGVINVFSKETGTGEEKMRFLKDDKK